jgi:hypothetical protein
MTEYEGGDKADSVEMVTIPSTEHSAMKERIANLTATLTQLRHASAVYQKLCGYQAADLEEKDAVIQGMVERIRELEGHESP